MSLHISTFTRPAAELARLVFVDDALAGFLVEQKHGYIFQAVDPVFALLDGSRFVLPQHAERSAARLKRAS
ncbi:hypothetical protein [Rhodoligotrophos ferricapiens]|uniref:hypothetical protein n=1 Tax=Rhodoligotrophos ferricapiens TaxID=3069264 RepID=UPI00315D1A6C